MHCFVVAMLLVDWLLIPLMNKVGWIFLKPPENLQWFLKNCVLTQNSPYSSYHNYKTDSNGPKRWTPPPIFINCLFLGFPMVLVIATLPPVIGLSLNHNQITTGVISITNTLRQGASIWDQLKVPSTTNEEKHKLTTQLNQVMSQLKDLGVHISIHAERLKVCLHSFIWVMLVLLCITFLVSTLYVCWDNWNRQAGIASLGCRNTDISGNVICSSFLLLYLEYWFTKCNKRRINQPAHHLIQSLFAAGLISRIIHPRAGLSPRIVLTRIRSKLVSWIANYVGSALIATYCLVDTLLIGFELVSGDIVHLILRSMFIIIAMCTNITLCIIGIVKSHDGSIRR
jgi:hypothetical protein